MDNEFIRLQPNQMLAMKALIAIGPANSYSIYQRIKDESVFAKIASITMVYPVIDSLIKKGLVEITEQKDFGMQKRKKYQVTGIGQRVYQQNQQAYFQLSGLQPQGA